MTALPHLDFTAPASVFSRPRDKLTSPEFLEPLQLTELRAKWAAPPVDWASSNLARSCPHDLLLTGGQAAKQAGAPAELVAELHASVGCMSQAGAPVRNSCRCCRWQNSCEQHLQRLDAWERLERESAAAFQVWLEEKLAAQHTGNSM